MTKSKGIKHENVPGMIYVVQAVVDPIFGTNDSGYTAIKLGIAYGDRRAMKIRLQKQKTGCFAKKQIVAQIPVDENTEIPTPEGTLGGVYEMESFLHHVFELNGWKHVGDGMEWFAVPVAVVNMLDQIRACKNGSKKTINWAVCPELARAFAYAPEHDDIPAFDESRTKKTKAGKKVSTVRFGTNNGNGDGRSPLEERMDKAAPRKHALDYMLRRGAVTL